MKTIFVEDIMGFSDYLEINLFTLSMNYRYSTSTNGHLSFFYSKSLICDDSGDQVIYRDLLVI